MLENELKSQWDIVKIKTDVVARSKGRRRSARNKGKIKIVWNKVRIEIIVKPMRMHISSFKKKTVHFSSKLLL